MGLGVWDVGLRAYRSQGLGNRALGFWPTDSALEAVERDEESTDQKGLILPEFPLRPVEPIPEFP